MFPYSYIGPGGSSSETVGAGQVVGNIVLLDGHGEPDDGGEISFRLSEPPAGDGISYSRTAWTATADDDGELPIADRTFVASAWYIGRRAGGVEVPFETPSSGSFDLPVMLSRATPL